MQNGLFLLLCLAAAVVGPRMPVLSLSIASLCGLNGLVHVAGTVRARQYAPGLVTGVLLYLPLAILAYYLAMRSGEISVGQAVGAVFLGLIYQAVPIGALAWAYALQRS